MFEDTITDIIKKAREGLGLSLRTLADQTGIPVSEIQKIEEGKTPPKEKLLDALGLSPFKFDSVRKNAFMPAKIPEIIKKNLRLKTLEISTGGIVSNAYILIHEHYALLVDSVGASENDVHFLSNEGFEPLFLLITHGHFDHIGGIERVQASYPNIRIIHGGKDVPCDTRYETDGFSIDAIRTPGHTEDSVSYFVNDAIAFVGDTIFARSIGRPNYSLESLLKNIREKIFILNDSVILAPGHGPLTTVGEEKKNNPFF